MAADRQSLPFNIGLLKKKTFIENIKKLEDNTCHSIENIYGMTGVIS